jgi:hypothetical protein
MKNLQLLWGKSVAYSRELVLLPIDLCLDYYSIANSRM